MNASEIQDELKHSVHLANHSRYHLVIQHVDCHTCSNMMILGRFPAAEAKLIFAHHILATACYMRLMYMYIYLKMYIILYNIRISYSMFIYFIH